MRGMNREQLAELIFGILHDNQWSLVDELSPAQDDLVDALWPVLAQVWAEGYEVGWDDRTLVRDGHLTKVTASNPYSEAAQPVT